MPDSSSTVKTIPTPLHPTAGDTLQNDAPAFSWSDVDGATAYHLQVAPTDAFETLLFDSSVGNHTSLTVYDAVPQDGGTYYWRVRAETTGGPTAWSTPASFTAGESIAAKAASQATQPAPSDAPTIREPTEGAPVDGQSAEFHWNVVPNAVRYDVEIAATPDFDDPLTMDPGETTTLTLYSMLPVDGSTFFWRVRAQRPNQDWTAWSQPAQFTAATDEDWIAYQEEQERKEKEAADAQAKETALAHDEERFSPVLSARTSPALSLGVSSFMVLSFLVTLVLVARAI